MNDDIAIKVEHVSKNFKLPHEKTSSIKSVVINFYKRNKTYEIQKALEDISFDVEKGDFFAIVGRNGSGKSTLLKMLAGIYAPNKGSIQVNGKLTPFIELGVGFSPELTGRENVFLNGALLGFNRKEMDAMYQDIVDFAEIERFMDQRLKNYSSGMQVRLAFSIAIRAKSDILLLDEVLAVGDAAFQQKCYDYFEELKRQKRTVVFVSHDMSAVTRFCTRAVYIKRGKLILDGTPAEIADLYREENINKSLDNKATSGGELQKIQRDFTIDAKIIEQTDDDTLLEIKYRSKKPVETYVGISIIKDGTSVAELNTLHDKPLKGDGTLTYRVDKTLFNGGIYEFAAALFQHENRELLAFMKHSVQFVIKGSDMTRAAALKLPDTWQYNGAKGARDDKN